MPESLENSRRILRLRVAMRRFAPIFESDLSDEWLMLSGGIPGRAESIRLAQISSDDENAVSLEDVEQLQSSLGEVLDVLDEDPVGDVYYPYTAAMLLELYCRSATGDLPDDAPVSLEEWVARFARHVDWQLEKSGIPAPEPAFFARQEEALAALEVSLSGNRDAAWLDAMEKSGQLGEQYLRHLTRAVRAG
ncbi:hypothetical protein [Streptomyces sp. NL15-2K]|uniref:hypothetical protein n=1 Tax=Streptomyces sp. NL15-2K TaxID=376149 RepID=UPI000F576785|nr:MULTISPECIES: hypothetical protein [Actinomycetes]WKX09790.1 hypothetical protein Q4V64_20765 [Kutzneria buriramensis]